MHQNGAWQDCKPPMSEKREQSIVTIWPANATVQAASGIQDR